MKTLLLLLLLAQLRAAEIQLIDGKDFPNMGMFAATNQILGWLSIYETKQPRPIDGLSVDFAAFGLYYDPDHGSNWWNYYFEPLYVGNQEKAHLVRPSKTDHYEAFKKRRTLSRAEAAKLVQKYIQVQASILTLVEEFASTHFAGLYTIGIHYRGTDKSSEAPRVPYSKAIEAIAAHIPDGIPWQIFAATDEHHFLEALQRAFPGKVIACQASRSENGLGVHFSQGDSYRLGQEALVDALLLSKCSQLIRTSSNLSLWSTYFNPDLPTTLLSRSYRSLENKEPE